MVNATAARQGIIRHMGGLTLLEMLVALAIFALLGVAAYSGLDQVLRTRAAVEVAAQRLQQVQLAMYFLEQDFAQIVPRPVRDEFGLQQPALIMEGGDDLIRFTRTGWDNPLGRDRPALQRLAYRLQGGTLERRYWQRLDRSGINEPRKTPLLTDLQGLAIRVLDADNQWQSRWPPAGEEDLSLLPRAVELRLELSDWGELRRLIPLASSAGENNG